LWESLGLFRSFILGNAMAPLAFQTDSFFELEADLPGRLQNIFNGARTLSITTFSKTRTKLRLKYHIIILVYFTVRSTSSGSAFVIAPNLGAKILSEYFTGCAPPILCS